MVPAMINSVNIVERIGDHVMDILKLCENREGKKLQFTCEATEELKEIEGILIEMFDNAIISLGEKNGESIARVVELEDKIDELSKKFQENHIKRLDEGICNVDSGVIYIDMISHFERIADYIYKLTMLTKDELFGTRRIIK